jgi:hypothetical protein
VCDHQLQPGDTVYVQINKVNIVQQWAIEANKGKPMVQVPTEYQDYADVFLKEKSRQLPPT